ncbi:similar to (N6-adenosine)-methyltransferase [Cyanidioschyzon merolae strain 10D]|jgi:N6-adenosine-specific RNA methylase IME4|uniref:mRNA m(6)A methyltransferase n=1 Tax=Cyanidioschyzon merolae (strain NIES-3377 / 10D) TaxID=280699 RepID=M1UPJ1_CYAM1|nr:similar to (N6-adenosine)-methyltransferase [Cyanidioschyzon merolae strain 10D]BAM79336.1 similar to (N6-adenosine)-methyltransferase [Cyanidioschyzon merolae strain 10D]|eukprot:XP_005535622.1 similar to (N6-adenosine)-methyltransferase [Cyanidioschyzon merolae strain 10D]
MNVLQTHLLQTVKAHLITRSRKWNTIEVNEDDTDSGWRQLDASCNRTHARHGAKTYKRHCLSGAAPRLVAMVESAPLGLLESTEELENRLLQSYVSLIKNLTQQNASSNPEDAHGGSENPAGAAAAPGATAAAEAAVARHEHPGGNETAKADALTDSVFSDLCYVPEDFMVPPHCIPVRADVRFADWDQIAAAANGNYDVILMDPPWQLATANPTRGVALGYNQLSDESILAIPLEKLQRCGLLLIWVINAKYRVALQMFERWGYRLVDEIVWVKLTVNRRLAKNHGFYLQHAKETCLVGVKGNDLSALSTAPGMPRPDVILSERRGQSQKPDELYEWIEALVPNGKYIEIFARKNNLRNFWVSIGNEVTGESFEQALPPELCKQLREELST